MKHSRLREIIKEEINSLLERWEPQRQPSAPERVRPSVEPAIKEPDEKTKPRPKRRTLRPPTESPDTKPKALMEKEIMDRITQRFRSLKKK